MSTAVDLVILTGFLGSGKTTLLADFLRSPTPATTTGVIVNEVGKIGLDAGVIHTQTGSLPFALLDNGCVCCSVRNDLLETVEELLAARKRAGSPLNRIIVETTGLARPGPIVASLAVLSHDTRTTVVSTYDLTQPPLRSDGLEEAAAQVAGAHKVAFTKLDIANADLISQREIVRGVNPFAEIVSIEDPEQRAISAFTVNATQKWHPDFKVPQLASDEFSHARVSVVTGVVEKPLQWSDFAEWTENLAAFCGDRLLRMKAVVEIDQCAEPVLVQSVGATFTPPMRMANWIGPKNVVVVIMRDLGVDDVRSITPALPIAFAHRTSRAPSLRHHAQTVHA